MPDSKELLQMALKELEEDRSSPLNLAIEEIIRVEKNFYYAPANYSGKLREVRDIIIKYSSVESLEEGKNEAD